MAGIDADRVLPLALEIADDDGGLIAAEGLAGGVQEGLPCRHFGDAGVENIQQGFALAHRLELDVHPETSSLTLECRVFHAPSPHRICCASNAPASCEQGANGAAVRRAAFCAVLCSFGKISVLGSGYRPSNSHQVTTTK
jgi:hypothetical protein